MTNSSIIYPYKPPKWVGFLSFILCSAFTCLFVWIALDNDSGLNVSFYRLFTVSFEDFGATLVYWGFVAFFFALSCVSLVVIYNSFTLKTQLIITDKDISVPVIRLHTTKIVTIPFDQIVAMKFQNINSGCIFSIFYGKRKVNINSILLPKKNTINEVVSHLEQKLAS